MEHRHHSHQAFHRARRAANPAPERFPMDNVPIHLDLLPSKPLDPPPVRILPRDGESTCLPGDNTPACEKPTRVNNLPIILGAVIPIVAAIIVLIFLHRRHIKKLKQEDLKDESKYKSMDFGMTEKVKSKEMGGDPEKSTRGRGMSLDMGSPYILPPTLHGSRDSLQSLSRSLHDSNDPYRPVTFIRDNDSIRTPSRMRPDNASTYTADSVGTDRINANLLRNAQRVSMSTPPTGPLSPPPAARSPGLSAPNVEAPRDSYFDKNAQAMRKSNNYLGQFIDSGNGATTGPSGEQPPATSKPQINEPAVPTVTPPPQAHTVDEKIAAPANDATAQSYPSRIQSQQASMYHPNTASYISDGSDYGDGFKVTPPSPRESSQPQRPRSSTLTPMPSHPEPQQSGLGVQGFEFESKRLSVSVRPLPAEDPSEDPEQRANRIRSFYKEYFDDSKPDPAGDYAHVGGPYAPQANNGGYAGGYYEDYDQHYLEGSIFDPQTGNFIVAAAPYAEPITRRAMTPPPRAPPRFQGHPRSNQSTSSGSRFMSPPPPRGRSVMSARSAPKKPLPPPTTLTSLPTPHMLKEDSMVFNPIDFAPPTTFRDRQLGRRPDSPLGVQRPYSPAVAPHTPLASPFEDLNPMPSPHALRKSGTFTALDFAPPPRFRMAGDTASDAGSIRSNRSGISAVQLHSIRNGAYRVSRIPKGVVGTKDDFTATLRPTWDQRGAA